MATTKHYRVFWMDGRIEREALTRATSEADARAQFIAPIVAVECCEPDPPAEGVRS